MVVEPASEARMDVGLLCVDPDMGECYRYIDIRTTMVHRE